MNAFKQVLMFLATSAIGLGAAAPDGILDEWRLKYFKSADHLGERTAAIADPDEDGFNNFQEFVGRSNPLAADSIPGVPAYLRPWAAIGSLHQPDMFAREAFDRAIGPGVIQHHPTKGILFSLADVPDMGHPGPRSHRVGRIDSSGRLHFLAGQTNGPGLVNGVGAETRMASPIGQVVDSRGNIFVAEWHNNVIRRVDPSGNVSVFAGSELGYRDGKGANAQFRWPVSLAIDENDNLYVGELHGESRQIRKISPDGMVSTFGSPSPMTRESFRDYQDGHRTNGATFGGIQDLAYSVEERALYFSNWMMRNAGAIRRIGPDGMVSTVKRGLPWMGMIALDRERCLLGSSQLSREFFKLDEFGNRVWTVHSAAKSVHGAFPEARLFLPTRPVILPSGDILICNAGEGVLHIEMEPPRLLTAKVVATTKEVSVSLASHWVTNGIIRFTTDGAEPTAESSQYTADLNFNEAADIRARVFVGGLPVSAILQLSPRLLVSDRAKRFDSAWLWYAVMIGFAILGSRRLSASLRNR